MTHDTLNIIAVVLLFVFGLLFALIFVLIALYIWQIGKWQDRAYSAERTVRAFRDKYGAGL